MGAWPSAGAPAVARLAAPGTRRWPMCAAAPGAAHVSSPGAICSPHTSAGCVAPYAQCHAVPSATGCPVPRGTHGSAWRGWRAGRLQESQACAAAGQPERGGCHGPDIRAAHPVPRGTRVVPAPRARGVRAVPRYGLAEHGSASSPWLGGSGKPPPERGQVATGTVTCPSTDRAHAGRRGLALPTGPGSPLRRPAPRPRPLPGPAATVNPKGLLVPLSPTEATPVTTCCSTQACGRDEAEAPAPLPPTLLCCFQPCLGFPILVGPPAGSCSAEEEPRCHFPQHRAPRASAAGRDRIPAPPAPPCHKGCPVGPPRGTWPVPSAHGLSSLGWLRVPSPTGCPRPWGGCAGTPGSYSQRLELGTGMGMFLNRGLQFTCTGTRRGGAGFSPRGPHSRRGGRGRHLATKRPGSAPTAGHGNRHRACPGVSIPLEDGTRGTVPAATGPCPTEGPQ